MVDENGAPTGNSESSGASFQSKWGGPPGEFAFSLFIFVYLAILLALTFSFRSRTALFPLIVLSFSLAFLLLFLVGNFFPAMREFIKRFGRGVSVDLSDIREGCEVEPKSAIKGRDEAAAMLTLMLLLGLILLLGFELGLVLYLFFIAKARWKKSLLFSLIYTGCVYGGIWVVFVFLANTDFYPGLLNLQLPW